MRRGQSHVVPDFLPAETWRPVFGWEQFYEVSDLGRIRSMIRVGSRTQPNKKYGGYLLRPSLTPNGYLVVYLISTSRQVEVCQMPKSREMSEYVQRPCETSDCARHGRTSNEPPQTRPRTALPRTITRNLRFRYGHDSSCTHQKWLVRLAEASGHCRRVRMPSLSRCDRRSQHTQRPDT